jgi:hypothetical protein
MHSKFYFRLPLFLAGFFLNSFAFSQIVINEYSASNLDGFPDNYDKYEDWIELYNSGFADENISGFGLSDNPDNPLKWVFPANTIIEAGGFLRIWTSGRDEYNPPHHYHSGFKLNQTKDETEWVVFSDPEGYFIDYHQLQITQKEHSRGRIVDGGTDWGIFTNPTPRATNNNSTAYSHYAAKPEASHQAGFYEGNITLNYTTAEPDAQIRFTLNGNEPLASSQLYTAPLSITSTTIVKARTFSQNDNVLPGLIDFNTYFIDEDHDMAMMSVAANELLTLLNGNQGIRPFGSFEYFDKTGERTTIGYGEYNEHGQDSWVHDQRSIDYVSRDECGYNYAIREQLIPFTERDEYQRLILRAAGDDNYPGIDSSAHLRDYFVQNIAELGNMHLDVRKGQKGVLYANGQYWGVYGFREKVDDHDFTEFYYGQDKYNLHFLKLWGGTWAEYGGDAAFDDWHEIRGFMLNQDMSVDENWAYVKSRYDYRSLVDYIHINSYVVCSDWINWNVGWWRGLNPDGGHQKWGYILWDEDATFAHYINYTGVPGISPVTSPCYPEILTADPGLHIEVLNKLRTNEEFMQYYLTRYIDLYNTVFHPDNMNPYLDFVENEMVNEMTQHTERWGGSMTEWTANVNKIRNFVTARHDFLPTGFAACWNLYGPHNLTVSVQPDGVAAVHLNSLELLEFPSQLEYFGGVMNHVSTEILNQNYQFDFWEMNNHQVLPNDTANHATFELTNDDVLIAHFKLKTYSDSLVINEINYKSSSVYDTEDWVEFYNPHPYDLNIENWFFRDDNDDHKFIFPQNTIIPSEGYLVLCRDSSAFRIFFPEVYNVYGNMDFGFSSNGELLRLYNDQDVLIDFVEYGISAPWPSEPNGNGPTLELILPHYNNELPESWMVLVEAMGTPGAMNSFWVGLNEQGKKISNLEMKIVPNPTTSAALITITGHNITKGTLMIYNTYGEVVRRMENIASNQILIKKQNLEKGLFIIQFWDEITGKTIRQKLIVR